MALVDPVADRLPGEVRPQCPAAEPMALEQFAPVPGVGVVGQRPIDLEVVTPAGELEPVEAPFSRHLGELTERQVGPLAGEKRDGSGHRRAYRNPGAPSPTRGCAPVPASSMMQASGSGSHERHPACARVGRRDPAAVRQRPAASGESAARRLWRARVAAGRGELRLSTSLGGAGSPRRALTRCRVASPRRRGRRRP